MAFLSTRGRILVDRVALKFCLDAPITPAAGGLQEPSSPNSFQKAGLTTRRG